MWDDIAKTATCLDCNESPGNQEAAKTEDVVDSGPTRFGTPGASARNEYNRRHDARERRINSRFGFMAPVVKIIAPDPQTTVAWSRGAIGEEKLGAALSRRLADGASLLADCSVPKSRSNIDFIAIAKSGIWVIDAKRYTGAVQIRDLGGWRTVDKRLYVGGRDRTKHLDSLTWQVDAVQRALDGEALPIAAVFCMVDAEFGFFAKAQQLHGVWIVWGKKLAEMILGGAPLLDQYQVTSLTERLLTALPPHTSAS